MFSKRKGLLHALAGAAALGAVLLSGATAMAVTFPIQIVWDGSTTVFPIAQLMSGSTQAPATYPYATFAQRNATQFGSGAGRCNLLWGNIDVANSSGNISSGDNQFNGTANDYGTIPPAAVSNCDGASPTKGTGQVTPFTTSQIDDWAISHDGVIMVVNSSTLAIVTDISQQAIANIYSCSVATAPAVPWTNWTQVNASFPNQTIKPIARDLASGTRQSLLDLEKNFGMNDANEQACITAAGTTRATGNPNVQTAVASTPFSIGYVGHGFDVFTGGQALTVAGIAGSDPNILNGSYPLSRLLHMMTLQYAVSPAVARGTYAGAIDFVNYALSTAGQADVLNSGFIPMQTPTVIPDWDINVDHVTNVNDVVLIGQAWLQSQPGEGHWIRQDVNRDGVVNVNDIATLGQHWLTTWTSSIQ